jgi:plastocyanin
MNKKYLLAGILVIAFACCFIFLKTEQSKILSNTSSQNNKLPKPLPKEVTVTLDKNGFSPKVVTINAGSAIMWTNKSGDKQTVNSDNYPTNQLYRELNFGIFANGSTVTYTFTKPGVYGYHNQLNHTQMGKVIVEK